ncbi:OmpH family outer membrane protein [Sulfitobacter noctilucicola]|uniref:OmpH family outer membrane protein n=1 Tax=Sulfitobacter noctilucicola TaxID=1342301 RepID=UPI000565FF13|nr:OmpH family outer membrane protein [Sulfitobacter noctilucicola]
MTGQPSATIAQQTSAQSGLERGSIVSAVLTIDSERLFLESAFGQRVAAEVEEQGEQIATENRRIEAELEAEEKRLTDLRATMAPEEFRALANEFDEKVQRTRTAQAAKGRALNELLEKEREVFLAAAAPVMERLMSDAGATVILEQRSVFVSASAIEITDDAIALLDETLGSGE